MKHWLERNIPILGPLNLLFAVGLGVSFDLLLMGALGLYLCARWHFRGCVYASILLAISAVIRHGFFITDHLWWLGLEGSFLCSFFISALAFKQNEQITESLRTQIQTGESTVQNLEEEFVKAQEIATALQIESQEKMIALQKELEELQAEYTSVLILNEVLRKTNARNSEENEKLNVANFENRRQIDLLKEEIERLEKDWAQISNTDEVVLQNKELMDELNEARFEKQQTHLINETLARLYVRENLKHKEVNEEMDSRTEELIALRQQTQKMTAEIAHLQNEKTISPSSEQLAFTQEKMVRLSQIEPQLLQLKKQFAEKNETLAQTRMALFKTDTEIQRLKIEKSMIELNPIPKEVEEELQSLNDQMIYLEEENEQLQELITILTDVSNDPGKRKKKLRMVSPEQEFLF